MKYRFIVTSLSTIFNIALLSTVVFLIACNGDDEVDACEGFTASASGSETEITLTITEGTAPYGIKVVYTGGTEQNETTSASPFTFTADLYEGASITVTDALGCETTAMIADGVLLDPCEDLTVDVSGSVDEITLSVSEGTAPFDYVITYTGNTTQEVTTSAMDTVIIATAYEGASVAVTDASGCTQTVTLDAGELSDPCEGFVLEVSGEDSEITFDITAGTAPFDYTITYTGGTIQSGTIATTTVVVDAYEGATVVLTDAKGCTATDTLEEDELSYPCEDDFEVEAEGSDGEITLTITSGTAPYDYEITYDGDEIQTGSTSDEETVIPADENEDADIVITDANGCTTSTTVSEADLTSLLDTRDGQRYGIVELNDEFWLTENFNYDDGNGECYDLDEDNCATYGKLYTWEAATADDFAPEGWSLPTSVQVQELKTALDPFAGSQLNVGGDTGLQLQLGGGIKVGTSFIGIEDENSFWTGTETDGDATEADFFATGELALVITNTAKTNALSVRLIKQ